MVLLLRVDPATATATIINPYAGERAGDLDGATLETCWDGRPAPTGVAFSVACYDTSVFERRPCVDVLVELDDGCDTHNPYTDVFTFTLGRWGELRVADAGSDPAAAPHDDAPRIPWVWLSDEVRLWVWQFAADWWASSACQSRPQPTHRRQRHRRRWWGRWGR